MNASGSTRFFVWPPCAGGTAALVERESLLPFRDEPFARAFFLLELPPSEESEAEEEDGSEDVSDSDWMRCSTIRFLCGVDDREAVLALPLFRALTLPFMLPLPLTLTLLPLLLLALELGPPCDREEEEAEGRDRFSGVEEEEVPIEPELFGRTRGVELDPVLARPLTDEPDRLGVLWL